MSNSRKQSQTEYLTTGTIARNCGVSKVTVLRWIDKGYLEAFRLPEGHFRIHRDDFKDFMEKHGIPFRDRVLAE